MELGMIEGTFNYTGFFQDPTCSAAFTSTWVIGSQIFDGNFFKINFDLQSFVIAMAVNLGYISLETLETAQTQYDPVVLLTDDTYITNVTYSMSQYFDLRYASMSPIMCIRNLTQAPSNYMTVLCMLDLPLTFELYAVPIFNSGGIATGTGFDSCSCSQDSIFDLNCDTFHLISGMWFYNDLFFYDTFAMYLKTIAAYPSYHAFNEAMTPALYFLEFKILSSYDLPDEKNVSEQVLLPCTLSSIPGSSSSSSSSSSTDEAYRRANSYTCTVLGINSFDYNSANNQVSDHHYILKRGSCNDSLSIPRHTWFVISICMYVCMHIYSTYWM